MTDAQPSLGLPPVAKRRSAPLGRRHWTVAEEVHLRREWGRGVPPITIGRDLHRTPAAIVRRAGQLGLAPQVRASFRRRPPDLPRPPGLPAWAWMAILGLGAASASALVAGVVVIGGRVVGG